MYNSDYIHRGLIPAFMIVLSILMLYMGIFFTVIGYLAIMFAAVLALLFLAYVIGRVISP